MKKLDSPTLIDCSHLESSAGTHGGIAIVGIGNPLHEEDSGGLELVSLFHESTKLGVCCINLELFTGYLPAVYRCHKALVIVDTVSNLETDASCVLEIDKTVLEASGNLLKASHGISWLEELKLLGEGAKKVFLFGISSRVTDVRVNLTSLFDLVELLEEKINVE